jgi:hypothetical protein
VIYESTWLIKLLAKLHIRFVRQYSFLQKSKLLNYSLKNAKISLETGSVILKLEYAFFHQNPTE